MSINKHIPQRDEILDKHKWNLSHLFNSDEGWESLYGELEEGIKGYASFKGYLGESVDLFSKAIEFDLEISRRMDRLFTYAHLKSDEDKTNQEYFGFQQRAIALHARISELSSFMTPEIQAIPEDDMNGYIKDERIKKYSFHLEKILRFREHTLSEGVEEVLAMSREIAYAPSLFFTQLDNADLKFGMLEDEDGNEIELSHGNFVHFLMSRNSKVREKAFSQYYGAYKDHKHSIAASLSSSIKKDSIYARIRKFNSSKSASIFPDNIPEEVYDNLVDVVKGNLSPLFEYLDFRKKVLGLKVQRFCDIYAPIVDDIKFGMPFEEAVDLCANALAPLGDEYVRIMREGLLGGWVDRYENRGKRSGAYSSGCYDSPPYILLNYHDDNINSIYTLIHEAGHSMHSYYSAKTQPYVYHSYSIFVAEVASTFNEVLLSNYLLSRYKDDNRMRAYILNREIDNIRGTLFRQTMFAHFENITHNMVEENKALTLDILTSTYKELLEIYFGDTVEIDESIVLECLRIPHFYSSFYVYQYATGISASIALAKRVQQGGELARDAYLKFLSMGSSAFPIDELLVAGVDMRSEQPIIDAVTYFKDLVGKFIQVYNEL
ncbi:MAG: oligoendopeptidase F [Spirochaetota bacterium]|nr:oligoendopeptidase F [Spirochaetota bacterium]